MGLFKSIGSFLNDFTGATSASNAAYSQSRSLANLSYQHQKEFAQNAHQWEMEDLKKAGLNPALTTGASSAGSIAGGGSTGGQGQAQSSGIDLISTLAGTINQTRQTDAQINQAGAQSELFRAQAISIIEKLPLEKKEKDAIIKNIQEDTRYKGYFPTTIGNNQSAFGFGGGTTTTVYSKGGKIRVNGRHNKDRTNAQ